MKLLLYQLKKRLRDSPRYYLVSNSMKLAIKDDMTFWKWKTCDGILYGQIPDKREDQLHTYNIIEL